MLFTMWIGQRLRLLLFLLILGSFSNVASPALSSAVLRITTAQAQGSANTQVQRIVLGTGQGVNLSFLPTGEKIQKVWLDDPSRVVIDFDGCLASAGSPSGQSGGQGGGCGEASSAFIVHIRQLSERIPFPTTSVSGNGKTVLLTVITEKNGSGQIYTFSLMLGGTMPPNTLVEVVPSAPVSEAQVSTDYQKEVQSQLSRGMAIAESSSQLNSLDRTRLTTCIALMQSGSSLDQAMVQAGVSSDLSSRIRKLGITGSSLSGTQRTR